MGFIHHRLIGFNELVKMVIHSASFPTQTQSYVTAQHPQTLFKETLVRTMRGELIIISQINSNNPNSRQVFVYKSVWKLRSNNG